MNSNTDYISDQRVITLKEIRIGLLAGLFIYGLFSIIDPYMSEDHYTLIWVIRFAIVCPLIAISFFLSYTKHFKCYAKPLLMFILFIAELGILTMIYISNSHEPAYWGYYAGLILIILWSGFIFRFNVKETLFFMVSSVLLYNIVVHYTHGMYLPEETEKTNWLLANNFFLISAGILTLIGTFSIKNFFEDVQHKNRELKDGHKALSKAKIKAEESDMLKSAFLSNLSHEIRTPLNGIIGFAELLKDSDTSREEIKEYSDIVVNSSSQLLHIINNMLDLSMIQTRQVKLHFQKMDIHTSLIRVVEKYKKASREKGLSLTFTNDKSTEFILCTDHMRLRHILSHLVENAIKFTKAGQIEVGYRIENERVLFFICDTGIGIEKEYKDIIFDHFRQIEPPHTRSYRGAGIGLAIAKNMTHLLDGEIFIEKVKPHGTCFYVSLPKINERPGYKKHEKETDTPCHGLMFNRNIKILIAEDDDSCRQYLATILNYKRLHIIMAKDGKEAIAKFRANPDTDLILTDYKMPDMKGHEILHTIKKINSNVPVIAQTAFTAAEDKIKMMEYGFDGFLPKPFKSKDVIAILKQHIRELTI
ncbi:MAG: response regulator [Candidatus Delongbacteria bacterium]|jgi:signal transduction histidine kinase/ActR/RegA family two-component response regulator|nr:response regulator [Candidatus Delongbacteria bacterium]